MDLHTTVASIVANTTDLAKWCECQAQTLDKVHAATETRPMSPQECRHSVDVQREMLRRVGQTHVLWLTLLPGVLATTNTPPPPPPMATRAGPLRRWLRRVVG